jgi:hypothetical protein
MSTLDVQLSFSRATSLIGGATGGLPYQAATSSTVFAPIGSNGTILQSNGTTATWVALGGVSAGSSGQLNTIAANTSAVYYPTFVDANNASATSEAFYTTSSFNINPASQLVGIGTTSPTAKLHVTGANAVFDAYGTVNVFTSDVSTADFGGSVAFGGRNGQGTDPYVFGKIKGAKETGGTWNGYLSLGTTRTSSAVIEAVRIDSSGNLILNGLTGSGGSQFIMRGGTATTSEGPQIILGYGNNTSSAITGQANNTWNIDVATGTANNNLRVFRQNNGGATVVAWEVEEQTGGSRFWGIGVGTTASNTQGELRASNEITAYFSSDIRLKENIQVIEDPITIVNQIRGVRFDWTEEHIQRRGGEDGFFVRKHDIGVIAQEIEAVLPELVATRDDGYKAVKYEKIVPLLIEVVKAQQLQINQIREELNKLASK